MKPRTKKRVELYLDLFLKSLPLFVAIFFVGSVIFNIAYFRALNLDWPAFLSLSDYYEGSIFAVIHLFVVCIATLGLYLLQVKGGNLVKNLILKMGTLKIVLKAWKKCLIAEWGWLCIRQKMRFLKNIPFDIKREYLKATKQLKEYQEESFDSLTRIFLNILKILFLLFLGAFWLITVLYLIYITNWPILLIVFFTYIQLLLFKKNHKYYSFGGLFVVIGMFYFTCMWNLGLVLSQGKAGTDILSLFHASNSASSLARIGEEDYVLIRGLNRGVLVKNEEKILFFKWEDVKYLYKEKTEKQKNAKK